MSYSDEMLHGKSAARTLDAIRAGGQQLTMAAYQRLEEARRALEEGDFRSVMSRLHEAEQVIQPLANAQSYVAIVENGRVVRANDLEIGMVLCDVGEIKDLDKKECSATRCHGHVTLSIGEHEDITLDGDTTLFVEASEE